MSALMPVLFVGHGSPMNILAKNNYTASLSKLGQSLPRPAAILVISAHWQTKGTRVSCAVVPETVYDFYGFPQELYALRYPCPGSPAAAEAVVAAGGGSIVCDDTRGIDHAAWAVLHHMYPRADIPVAELSLDYTLSAQSHYDLAKILLPLRRQQILIIGSGNIVHNLRTADFADLDAPAYPWATQFDQHVRHALETDNTAALIHYSRLPHADLAVPTNEHYLPLLYTLALKTPEDTLCFPHEGIQNGSVSMRSLLFSPAGE